jgi:hypothetical protein
LAPDILAPPESGDLHAFFSESMDRLDPEKELLLWYASITLAS